MVNHGGDAALEADTAVDYQVVGAPAVPVIWFDTHAVSELAEAVASNRCDQQRPLLRDLHRRIVELRQANRIVVLETDQMYEVERRPDLVKRCVEMLTQLSQGARSSYTTVQRRQLEVGMTTRLACRSRAEIAWSTCWEHDPFADHSVNIFGGSVIVRTRFQPSACIVSPGGEVIAGAYANESTLISAGGTSAWGRSGRRACRATCRLRAPTSRR